MRYLQDENGKSYRNVRGVGGKVSRRYEEPPKKKAKKKKKPGVKECDRLFSLVVRADRKMCERCATRERLQCAHIVSRRYRATRFTEANAFCLCAGCHHWGHMNPLEFEDFVATIRGLSYLLEMKHEAKKRVTMDYPSLFVELTERLAELSG